MGTRSLTFVKQSDKKSKNIVCMYRQFDGYIDGHGFDLKNKFGNTEIINGISGQTAPDYANGMGCFAAQMISHFKEEIGGIYLERTDLDDVNNLEEYNYTIYIDDSNNDLNETLKLNPKLFVEVKNYRGEVLYDGLLKDLEDVEQDADD